ncbi:Macrolide export ATP-binding/permease protein MacB [Thermoflexales bacterium]|nr:Macrolide export ATP-binding/permease protein MacB [Thermoflexales bacterium]
MRRGYTKILRDLKRSWGRTVLAVLSIAIGVFAVGINSGMMELMPTRMLSSYQTTHPAHLKLWLDGAIDDAPLARLTREPGIAGVEGLRELGARWRLAPDQEWRDIDIPVRADYEHQQFNTVALISGAWPAKNVVAVEESSVEYFGLQPGGTVTLLINEREHEVKIGGVVKDIMNNMPAFGGNATIFISPEMAEDVWGWHGYTTLLVQVPQYSEQNAEAGAEQLKGTLEKMGLPVFFYRTFDPNKHFLQDMVNGVIMITTVMGVLALGLGLFLVVNTINALVAQQIPQIGIMKAIGGTTRQVMTLYLGSVLIYGLLALLIALPLGVLAADAIAEMLLKMMAIPPDPNVNISAVAVAQQVSVALLVPLLAALWPVYSGVRLSVSAAISNYGIGATFGKGLIDRLLARVRGLPRQTILTLRNTFRRKGRVVLTQITLIMAGVVFIMVMSSAASFTYTINYLTDSLGLKVLMYFQQPVRIEEAKAIIESQPNIEFAEFTLFQSSTAYQDKDTDEGQDIFINAVQPDSRLLQLTVAEGRWLLIEDEHAVVLSTDIAGKMGVHVGDKVYFKIDSDERVEWTVVGTVTDLSNMQRNLYVPLGAFQREVGLSGRGTTAWLSVTPDTSATQLQVEKDLREALNARGLKVSGTQTAESIRVNNENTFGIITTMLLTMSALIAVVGAIGLAGTLSINVLERRREIGVMRAIGASSLQIARLFVGEGLILGLMAWLIAIPLSVPVGQLFSQVIGEVINFGIVYQFSSAGALQWLIIVVVLSILGAALPAWRATRISIRESLAYE